MFIKSEPVLKPDECLDIKSCLRSLIQGLLWSIMFNTCLCPTLILSLPVLYVTFKCLHIYGNKCCCIHVLISYYGINTETSSWISLTKRKPKLDSLLLPLCLRFVLTGLSRICSLLCVPVAFACLCASP